MRLDQVERLKKYNIVHKINTGYNYVLQSGGREKKNLNDQVVLYCTLASLVSINYYCYSAYMQGSVFFLLSTIHNDCDCTYL